MAFRVDNQPGGPGFKFIVNVRVLVFPEIGVTCTAAGPNPNGSVADPESD